MSYLIRFLGDVLADDHDLLLLLDNLLLGTGSLTQYKSSQNTSGHMRKGTVLYVWTTCPNLVISKFHFASEK